jgi:hypothetical protein
MGEDEGGSDEARSAGAEGGVPEREAIAARASELLDSIAKQLARLGPPDWRRFEVVFSCTVSAEIARLRFWTDRSVDVVEVPESIVELVRRQRHIAAGMPAGPWWRLLLTVRRDQSHSAEVSGDYDYGDRPLPERDLLTPEHYRNDLATYPRAQVPAWLSEYVAGAGDPSKAGTSAQEFRVQAPVPIFARTYLLRLPQLALFFLFTTVLGSVPFGKDGLLPGLAIGFMATALLVVSTLARKARRGVLSTRIRMSAWGVEQWDDLGSYARLRWQDITSIDTVVTPGEKVDLGGHPVSMDTQRSGLIGWGEQSLPDGAPDWLRERLAQAPREPRSGAQQVAIPLGLLDATWERGPIGAWVRKYRPDLLPPTSASTE